MMGIPHFVLNLFYFTLLQFIVIAAKQQIAAPARTKDTHCIGLNVEIANHYLC